MNNNRYIPSLCLKNICFGSVISLFLPHITAFLWLQWNFSETPLYLMFLFTFYSISLICSRWNAFLKFQYLKWFKVAFKQIWKTYLSSRRTFFNLRSFVHIFIVMSTGYYACHNTKQISWYYFHKYLKASTPTV